ncbi:MAG: hypothetical protein FJ030_03665 [Chloroflexi bacterium]|nr:hypothetical protein [Chloroflexota bacterium]
MSKKSYRANKPMSRQSKLLAFLGIVVVLSMLLSPLLSDLSFQQPPTPTLLPPPTLAPTATSSPTPEPTSVSPPSPTPGQAPAPATP